MLPVAKHGEGVSVLVPSAEVRVATVLRVAQVAQGQGENLLHLWTNGALVTTLALNRNPKEVFLFICLLIFIFMLIVLKMKKSGLRIRGDKSYKLECTLDQPFSTLGSRHQLGS